MSTVEQIILNYDEFLAFILLYAAHEDLVFDKSEQEFIKNKVGLTSYDAMLELFNKTGHYNALQIIQNHKKLYFANKVDKKKMLNLIKSSFYVDGNFSKPEKNLLNFLDHLL